MSTPTRSAERKLRRELALLLVASFSIAAALSASVAGGPSLPPAGPAPRVLGFLTVTLLLFGAVIAACWHLVARARQDSRAARLEADALRASLATSSAVHAAEPQTVLLWNADGHFDLVTHSLRSVPGLPPSGDELLRFGDWLDARSADGLKGALDALLTEGRPFNLILKTRAGGHLEGHGRAAGTRAVLRLKDVAGYKRELGRVIDQHLTLARDIRAGRALLDALPMPVWLKDSDGRLSWVNRAYVSAVEAQSADEVIARQFELIESRQRGALEAVLARGDAYRERLNLVIGGTRKPHDVVVLPLEDTTVGAAIDVTAIESAQGELDRQIAAYDRTLDRVATAVAIFDRDQRLAFANHAFQELWQLDADWLAARPDDGALLDRLRALGRLPEVAKYREWKARLLDRYRTGEVLDEWWHLPGDRMLHVMSEQRPDGGLTYLYVDDTERMVQKGQYNALIKVQAETLNSLAEGVAVFGTDGRLRLNNTAFARIWHLPHEVLDRAPHIEDLIVRARALYSDAGTWAAIRRAVTTFTDKREPIDGQMVRPDASVVDYASTPLPDGGTLLTFADVTDAKRYERALEERNEALVVADRLKSQFIGHVSYELRTPLTNIIGFGELLSSPHLGPLNDKQREYVGHISASSKTLLAIIDDILDLTTIDAGALELKLAPLNIRALIDSAIRGVSERAADADLTLDIAIADDARTLVADEERARQVLYNLLSNAVGFSRPGGTVRVSCWRDAGHILFLVEDEGIGIPLEQQARVFERFESRSHGSKHRGAGLGLSIVRSLVDLHGGETALVSEPGKGTKVAVRFPEHGRQTRPADPTATERADGTSTSLASQRAS